MKIFVWYWFVFVFSLLHSLIIYYVCRLSLWYDIDHHQNTERRSLITLISKKDKQGNI